MQRKTYTKMAKKTKKEFFIKGKDVITDQDAPVVSDEFLDKRQPEGDYHGQTIEVKSDTKLEQDTGTGEAMVMRTFQYIANKEMFKNGRPSSQAIFEAHQKDIAGLLWSDGLTPATDVEPTFIFTPDYSKYLIMVWARPSIGQTLVDNTKTLTEILNGSSTNRDEV